MKVLVTGGNGFLGSWIVDLLSRQSHEIIVLDGRASRSAAADCSLVSGDPEDPHVFSKLPERIDAVCHLSTHGAGGAGSASAMERSLVGTYRVLEYSLRARAECVVYTSSSSVYRRPPIALPVGEDADLSPANPYAWSKLLGERILDSRRYSAIRRRISLRCGSIYGSGQRSNSVLPEFIRRRTAGEPLVVFSQGLRSQDFIHVSDAASAITNALENTVLVGSFILNLGSGVETTMGQLAQQVCEVFDPKSPHIILSTPRQDDDEDRFVLDITRLRAVIPFVPRSIREGLLEMSGSL